MWANTDILDYELIDIVGAKTGEWRPFGKTLLSIWIGVQSFGILFEGDITLLGLVLAILLFITSEAIFSLRLYGFFLGIIVSLIVIYVGAVYYEPLAASLTVVVFGILLIAYLIIRHDLFLATADEYKLIYYE